jgi:hypothetical protein
LRAGVFPAMSMRIADGREFLKRESRCVTPV